MSWFSTAWMTAEWDGNAVGSLRKRSDAADDGGLGGGPPRAKPRGKAPVSRRIFATQPASVRVSWERTIEAGERAFQAPGSDHQASFAFSELSSADHVKLSILAASLRPDDVETQATAGIYLELSGDTPAADGYYQKAGPAFEATLEELFE